VDFFTPAYGIPLQLTLATAVRPAPRTESAVADRQGKHEDWNHSNRGVHQFKNLLRPGQYEQSGADRPSLERGCCLRRRETSSKENISSNSRRRREPGATPDRGGWPEVDTLWVSHPAGSRGDESLRSCDKATKRRSRETRLTKKARSATMASFHPKPHRRDVIAILPLSLEQSRALLPSHSFEHCPRKSGYKPIHGARKKYREVPWHAIEQQSYRKSTTWTTGIRKHHQWFANYLHRRFDLKTDPKHGIHSTQSRQQRQTVSFLPR